MLIPNIMLHKNRLSLFWLCLLICLPGIKGYCQYTIIGTKQLGGTASYGPMLADDTADRYSRFAYIYPAATLGNLKHGDTIRSIEFFKDDFGGLKGKANFKIFIGSTAKADFGSGSLDWRLESLVGDVVKAYDGNPTKIVGNDPGYKRFDFDSIGYYVFDTTGGKINLEILTQFTCDSAQSQVVTWAYESAFTVSGFTSGNESKWKRGTGALVDYTNLNSINKPHLKINYFKYRNNLEVRNIYCLGTVPVLMGKADTIKAIIKNVGLATQINRKCMLSVRGSNFYNDTVRIDTIRPHQEVFIYFSKHKPDTLGKETITIYVEADGDTSNDYGVFERNVNYNVYSHIAPYKSMSPGGIGFNGSTGDFVAKFFTDTSTYINQMKVEFGFGGRNFQFGIWDADSITGRPGKNIFTSDTLMSSVGTVILPVLPRVKVNKAFFAGIRQTGTFNVGFAYQLEEPVRPDVFYFAAPLGDTSWVPFSPGYDFNFNIQPRLQVGDDISCWQINSPKLSDTFDYSRYDSISPSATFINYGFNNQTKPFPVVFQIRDVRSFLVYSDTQYITLKSEDTLKVNFSKKFSKNNLGQFRMSAFSLHPTDKVTDNDMIDGNFWLVVRNDFAVDNIFEPANSSTYELNIDSIWPVARVINYGTNPQLNVPITFRFRQDTTILYSRTKYVALLGGSSTILTFDTFAVKKEGFIWAEAFSSMVRDSFRANDTTRNYFEVVKSRDCGVSGFLRPLENGVYERNVAFRPFLEIRNYGIKDQDTIPVLIEIRETGGKLLFRDSATASLAALSKTQLLFKNFTPPDTVITLKVTAWTLLSKDQLRTNDTLSAVFSIDNGYDLAVVPPFSPSRKQRINAPTDSIYFNASIVQKGIKLLNETIKARCMVFNNNLLVIDDTITSAINLKKSDTSVIFSKSYFLSDTTADCLVFWQLLNAKDQNKLNDTFSYPFYITRKKDLALVSILSPFNQGLIEFNKDTISPVIQIFNSGSDNFSDGGFVYLTIIHNSTSIYSDIANLTDINSGDTLTISFAPFSHLLTGKAQVLAYIEKTDNFQENDTLKSVFFLSKSYDISCNKVVFPKDTVLVTGQNYQPVVEIENNGDKAVLSSLSVKCVVKLNGTEVYNNISNASLNVAEKSTINFANSLNFSSTGNAEIICYSLLPQDQWNLNDTTKANFTVEKAAGMSVIPSEFMIYPNPARENIHIESTRQIKAVKLSDTHGKVVYCQEYNQSKGKNIDISVKGLSAGIYSISIESASGLFVKKIAVLSD